MTDTSASPLIIDCHGHFTTEPAHFRTFRDAQVAYLEGRAPAPEHYDGVTDEELRTIIATNQLKLQRERGSDLTLLSPRASGMGHHHPDQAVASTWATLSNDTIARICALFPTNFAPVAQLPQAVGGQLAPVIAELRRCAELGFVAANVNPDPSGGAWTSPPVTDAWWDPLWEALVELRMPAMIHVSASSSTALHTTGAHYLSADTVVFMQLVQGDLFERHPDLHLVIPHGGGAVPYHWGRYRGLSMTLEKPPLDEHVMRNVSFDTCVYHQAGIEALFSVIPATNIIFGSELLGAVKATDPETGHPFDDTKRYIDRLKLDPHDRQAVFEGNARRIYPRLDAILTGQGR
jgi:4-oxalmesaconate hydratase